MKMNIDGRWKRRGIPKKSLVVHDEKRYENCQYVHVDIVEIRVGLRITVTDPK